MKNLFREATRGFLKKITQFIGLIFFVIAAMLTFTALFSSVFQVKNGVKDLARYSGTYQYEVKADGLFIDNNIFSTGEYNKLNRKFLSEFYDESKIDANKLTFNTIKSDLSNLQCTNDNQLCTWTTSPPYLNPTTGTASFTSLHKNYNENLQAAFLNYIILHPHDSGLDKIINNPDIQLDISYSLNYLFTFKSLINSEVQYYNISAVYKNPAQLFYDGDSWRSDNVFRAPFNTVYDADKNKLIQTIDQGSIYISRQYGDYNGIPIGGNLNLSSQNAGSENMIYKVNGWATKYSDIYPVLANMATLVQSSTTIDFKNGALLYGNANDFKNIEAVFPNGSETLTAYINISGGLTGASRIKLLSDALNNYFVSADDTITSFSNSFPGQVVMLTDASFIIDGSIAIACSIIIAIIIGFFIKKDIENQKRQIGVLKALGYQKYKLAFIFTCNIVFTMIIGCVLGWALSIPMQMYFTSSNIYSIGLPLTMFYFNPLIFTSAIIFAPVAFIILAFTIAFILLNRSALDLIYDLKSNNLSFKTRKVKKQHKKIWHLGLSFNIHLSFTFALKSLGKWIMVMVVLTFASFLLMFQLDAGVMAKNVVKNSFRYFKDDVKSYLITSYDQEDVTTETKGGTTYQWLSTQDEAVKFHPAKILNNGTTFNFPNPLLCFPALATPATYPIAPSVCGDFLNIIGDPNDSTPKSKISIENGKYPLLDSETLKAIVNYKVIANGTEVNGWDYLLNLLSSPWIQAILEKQGVTPDQIKEISQILITIRNLSSLIGGLYPKVYFGPYMVYNPQFDMPYTSKPARWGPYDNKNADNPVSDLFAVGLPSQQEFRDSYFNFESRHLSLQDVQNKVFGYTISSTPVGNDPQKAINEPIPTVLAKRVYESSHVNPGDVITVNVRVTNMIGYVPVNFKVIGSDDADISSGNLYTNENSLQIVMNQWINLLGKGVPFPTIPYHNSIATKIDNNGGTLQPYRILSAFSLKDDYDFTLWDTSGGTPKIDIGKAAALRANTKLINGFNKIWPFDTLREIFGKGMETVNDVLTVLESLTVIIVALILAVLISMVLDENKRIILTLKVLGYKVREIVFMVLGFYLLAVIIGYLLSYVVSELAWEIIINVLFQRSGMLLGLPFDLSVVGITIAVILIILGVAISLGLWRIKNNRLTNITIA
ncbi:ABC transporter permease [Spiroplasma eriocheiris]|uniref:ABC transporter permease n=1 Tax=Spiroplasma eriocheiris TaxID=315358 RepID=UPI0009A54C22|nr:ABC transporter permease [Spiroplasma eriocheiris]AHF58317.1 ABC-type transport system permease protein [Spiroplasma eriocheiris CCTCC M 207170]